MNLLPIHESVANTGQSEAPADPPLSSPPADTSDRDRPWYLQDILKRRSPVRRKALRSPVSSPGTCAQGHPLEAQSHSPSFPPKRRTRHCFPGYVPESRPKLTPKSARYY